MRISIAAAVIGLALIASGLVMLKEAPVHAAGACITSSASLTSEEKSFISLAEDWRAGFYPSAPSMQTSATLNAAASSYAEFLAANFNAHGHYAEPGYNAGNAWGQRAADCGWPVAWANGGGEGLAVAIGSVMPSVSPSAALAIMADTNGGTHYGGLYHPYANCVGVGYASDATNKKVAWVALLFQIPPGQSCPQDTIFEPVEPNTPAATETATPSPAPTATATPVPIANYGSSVFIGLGWNLVTLPAGPLADILDTANGCFSSVYKRVGDGWVRYSPLLPAYAQNLTTSDGGAFWIQGTNNCGVIEI